MDNFNPRKVIRFEAGWIIDYDHYEPENEKHTEAMTATGNGYFCTRGAGEERDAGTYHYPGTYIAGVYNRLKSTVAGREVENEDLVNCPDWTSVTFCTPAGHWFNPDEGTILSYRKTLDLKNAVLFRIIRYRHPTGEISTVRSARFVSMDNPGLAVMHYSVTAENYQGVVTFKSSVNGNIINSGVARYSELNQHHLSHESVYTEGNCAGVAVSTVTSKTIVAAVSAHTFFSDNNEISAGAEYARGDRFASVQYSIDVKTDTPVTLLKITGISDSRNYPARGEGSGQILGHAVELCTHSRDFYHLYTAHADKWNRIWKRIDIEITGDEWTQKMLRIHSYHLIISGSPWINGKDVSIGPRGLHGEAYRGHIFWDTLFMMPFYAMYFPETAREMLVYRYNRLPAARRYAENNNYLGAMFPWQSGSTGGEETQELHLNPRDGTWGEDYSCLQRHVSLAIGFNTWTYFKITNDISFLKEKGAELILSIALFWSSIAEKDSRTGKYCICGVMGPNEYHEKMPGSHEGGLRNNAYTNILTVWLLDRVFEIKKFFSDKEWEQLLLKSAVSAKSLEVFEDMRNSMYVDSKDGLISQYEGFLNLKELDWDAYKKKYGNIGRMDRILKAEGSDPDGYQLSKQADLLMLFYLIPSDELKEIFSRIGLPFGSGTLKKNYDYYIARTSHGSTLSFIVHSAVAATLGYMETSLEWYTKALGADVNDVQGGTVQEGIHTGLMAGTIHVLLFFFAGINLSGDVVRITPHLPGTCTRVSFNFTFRGRQYHAVISGREISVILRKDGRGPEKIIIKNDLHDISEDVILTVQ